MLDRSKIAGQLNLLVNRLFPDLSNQNFLAQEKWAEISAQDGFIEKVLASKSSFLLPDWAGNLDDTFSVNPDLKEYQILAVDGSQIYPDRNMSGAGCFLINTGGVYFDYGKLSSKVNFFSEPGVFLLQDFYSLDDKYFVGPDIVDLVREELEFKKITESSKLFFNSNKPALCFIDGSLIFWHLDSKHEEIKKIYLNKYLYYLDQLYKNNILFAGFISFPKSRELVNLIKLSLCRFNIADCIACHSQYNNFPCKAVDSLIDTFITSFFLEKNSRTTIFYSKSKIIKDYPDHLKPAFFYLNLGQEIARIEVPAFIAQDKNYLDLICKISIDQSIKGNGYPVSLAFAHDQAVVKGADRDFFYHLIYKISIENKKKFSHSQKSLKKLGMGI